jgi:hypothetical protein
VSRVPFVCSQFKVTHQRDFSLLISFVVHVIWSPAEIPISILLADSSSVVWGPAHAGRSFMDGSLHTGSSFLVSLPALAGRLFDTFVAAEPSLKYLSSGHEWLAALRQRGAATLRCARSMESDYSAWT